MPFVVECGGERHWYKRENVRLAPGAAPAAPAAPGGRPAVGARVVALPGADEAKCLGAPALGRVGELIQDDRDNLPFRVRCNGADSFYREAEIRQV